jgi:hypothetical protein
MNCLTTTFSSIYILQYSYMITGTTQEYISSTGRLHPESHITLHAFTLNFLIMTWNPTHLQRVLSQVLGDPLHRERCIWVAPDGNHCQNSVPIESRINGVLCFQLFQGSPSAYPPVQRLSLAAKQLFCFECRRHSRRPKVWANRILRLLDARLDQPENVMVQSETHDSALLVHPWPSSMSYSVGVAMCPDEASKTRRDCPKGQI